MTDGILIREDITVSTDNRFNWGVVIAGGIAASAVMFFLLSLGAGFGLMLINPVTEEGPSAPVFLTLGATYFIACQAFSFAVGGHLVGRYLGPVRPRDPEENFRVASHGFMSWAVALLATTTMLALLGLTAANAGANTAALYGTVATADDDTVAAFAVDRLYRPADAAATVPNSPGSEAARAEAGRIVMEALPKGRLVDQEDRDRLIQLTEASTALSRDEAAARVDALNAETKEAANAARKTASYVSLWVAVSLMFGAITASAAALFGRYEEGHTLFGRRVVRTA